MNDPIPGRFELGSILANIGCSGESNEFASGFLPMRYGKSEHDLGPGRAKFAKQMQDGH